MFEVTCEHVNNQHVNMSICFVNSIRRGGSLRHLRRRSLLTLEIGELDIKLQIDAAKTAEDDSRSARYLPAGWQRWQEKRPTRWTSWQKRE